MTTLTVGSVCSGYGGLEMGLAQVMDIDLRWHAEVDPDASLVLKTWWPEVPNLGDFTLPGFAAERVDVECGGVPCQGFSAAGRQLGAADPRHLWPDWRRGIAERLPSTVVFENVERLTRGKMRPIFDGIIADLLALGYDVRWCLLGACAVGAAHHRHRVFLLARRATSTPVAVEVKTPCARRGARLLPTPRAQDATRGPAAVDRNERLGRTPGPDLAQVLVGLARAGMGWGPYAEAIEQHAAVLGRPAPSPVMDGPRGGLRLAPAFGEWLMMLPAGHLTSVLDRNPALARAGNGVVPLQAATALRLLDEAMPR